MNSLEMTEQNSPLTSIRDNDVLTLAEASALLRCHPKTLRLMAVAGKIPGRRLGSLWRFSRAKLDEWMKTA